MCFCCRKKKTTEVDSKKRSTSVEMKERDSSADKVDEKKKKKTGRVVAALISLTTFVLLYAGPVLACGGESCTGACCGP